MTYETENRLDQKDWLILEELQNDARLSLSEIARRVGLTHPTVADRVKRLEMIGAITGYHAHVNPELLGFPIITYIRLVSPPDRVFEVVDYVQSEPAILECHQVTGEDSYFLKVAATSARFLEEILINLATYGKTSSSLVLSSKLTRRTIKRES